MAEVISWAFFPPLVATVFFIFLIFWYSADFGEGLKWVTFVAPFLIFLPLLFFAVTYKLGWVDDIDLTNRKDRPLYLVVFIISLVFALAILFFLRFLAGKWKTMLVIEKMPSLPEHIPAMPTVETETV